MKLCMGGDKEGKYQHLDMAWEEIRKGSTGQSLVVLVECRRRGQALGVHEAGAVSCPSGMQETLVECRRWGPGSEAGHSGMQEAGPWE